MRFDVICRPVLPSCVYHIPNGQAKRKRDSHRFPERMGTWMVVPLSLVRACAEMNSHSGASAGRADARRRDAGDAVPSSRSGSAADVRPPPRPCGLWARRPPGVVARSLHTTRHARRSRLTRGPGSLQQNVRLFLRGPLVSATTSGG
jgi:hypothetical protein